MEHEKRCLACGHILREDEESCPHCGLEGQNQFFLSLEDCDVWLAEQVIPRRRAVKPIRLFAGYDYVLILDGCGRLYGMGDNSSGPCGSDVPKEMKSPVLLAEHVRHAAAKYDNAAYVTEEGRVKIIGKGALAGAELDCRAAEVYADDYGFLIRDEDDKWFFFGDRTALGEREFSERVVMTLPKTEGIGNQSGYIMYAEYGGDYSEGKDPAEIPEDAEAIAAIKRSAEYRKIAEEYGEANVSVRADDILTGQVISSEQTHCSYYDSVERVLKCSFVPSIVVTDRYTRRLVPYEKPLSDLRFFYESRPTDEGWEDELKPGVKLGKRTGEMFGWIDWENTLRIEYRGGQTPKNIPEIKNITDFAFSDRFGGLILLVNEHNELLVGRDLDYRKQKWPDMKRIDL